MKRKIISVITTFVLILSSHFSMIYALDKPHLNLNEKKDPVQNNLNTSVIETEESVISGENLDTSQKTYVELIDNFVVACKY